MSWENTYALTGVHLHECARQVTGCAMEAYPWPASSKRLPLPDPRLDYRRPKIQLPMLVCRDVTNLCRRIVYPQVHTVIPSMPLRPRENIHDDTRMAAPVYNIKADTVRLPV